MNKKFLLTIGIISIGLLIIGVLSFKNRLFIPLPASSLPRSPQDVVVEYLDTLRKNDKEKALSLVTTEDKELRRKFEIADFQPNDYTVAETKISEDGLNATVVVNMQTSGGLIPVAAYDVLLAKENQEWKVKDIQTQYFGAKISIIEDLAKDAEKEEMTKQYRDKLDLKINIRHLSYEDESQVVKVSGSIKNNGDKPISDILVKVYYKDATGKNFDEHNYDILSSWEGQLKQNYIRNFDSDYGDVPKDWKEQYGFDYEIAEIEFGD